MPLRAEAREERPEVLPRGGDGHVEHLEAPPRDELRQQRRAPLVANHPLGVLRGEGGRRVDREGSEPEPERDVAGAQRGGEVGEGSSEGVALPPVAPGALPAVVDGDVAGARVERPHGVHLGLGAGAGDGFEEGVPAPPAAGKGGGGPGPRGRRGVVAAREGMARPRRGEHPRALERRSPRAGAERHGLVALHPGGDAKAPLRRRALGEHGGPAVVGRVGAEREAAVAPGEVAPEEARGGGVLGDLPRGRGPRHATHRVASAEGSWGGGEGAGERPALRSIEHRVGVRRERHRGRSELDPEERSGAPHLPRDAHRPRRGAREGRDVEGDRPAIGALPDQARRRGPWAERHGREGPLAAVTEAQHELDARDGDAGRLDAQPGVGAERHPKAIGSGLHGGDVRGGDVRGGDVRGRGVDGGVHRSGGLPPVAGDEEERGEREQPAESTGRHRGRW